MKKDFDGLCELHDAVFEAVTVSDVTNASKAKGEEQQQNIAANHKKYVESYLAMQRSNRKVYYSRGINIGIALGGVAALIGTIIREVIVRKKK